MTDREMLELAAKAMGIAGRYFESDNPIHTGIFRAEHDYYWNPLISDSEALRLAVKLGLLIDARYTDPMTQRYNQVHYRPKANESSKRIDFSDRDLDPCDLDPCALTRRAIVRAAAALGAAA